jgi:parallel beta-helix repeat protein
MKQIFLVMLLACAVLYPSSLHAQGSLTPSAPPGPTMLTLSQVEPRTPVDAIHTPGNSYYGFTINQSGSYYLTTNIVCTNSTGILILANNVTLDMNGFSVTGVSGAGGAGYGIYIAGGFSRIRVCNGIVNGWADYGVASAANDVVLERLAVSGNTGSGVVLSASYGNVLRDSTISGNTNYGIWCDYGNATLDNLSVSGNGSSGIYFQGYASSLVKDCLISGNYGINGYGINCYESTNINLEHLTISGNESGIYLNIGGNNIISDCGITGNTQSGIQTTGSGSLISDNTCSGNPTGIYISGNNNRIENNHITGGTTGIEMLATGTNNIVVKNSVEGCINDYYFGSPQIAGPLITNAISGVITNSNPWANFAF